MRILFSIDQNWTVPTAGLPPRQLVKTPDGAGGFVPILDAAHHAAEPPSGLMAGGAATVYATYDRLMKRAIPSGDPEAFGCYLFDCVVGANWDALRNAVSAGEW